jgi:hypothetical protein
VIILSHKDAKLGVPGKFFGCPIPRTALNSWQQAKKFLFADAYGRNIKTGDLTKIFRTIEYVRDWLPIRSEQASGVRRLRLLEAEKAPSVISTSR